MPLLESPTLVTLKTKGSWRAGIAAPALLRAITVNPTVTPCRKLVPGGACSVQRAGATSDERSGGGGCEGMLIFCRYVGAIGVSAGYDAPHVLLRPPPPAIEDDSPLVIPVADDASGGLGGGDDDHFGWNTHDPPGRPANITPAMTRALQRGSLLVASIFLPPYAGKNDRHALANSRS